MKTLTKQERKLPEHLHAAYDWMDPELDLLQMADDEKAAEIAREAEDNYSEDPSGTPITAGDVLALRDWLRNGATNEFDRWAACNRAVSIGELTVALISDATLYDPGIAADKKRIYYAAAVDRVGRKYTVLWRSLPSWDPDAEGADETEACDWHSPTQIELQ